MPKIKTSKSAAKRIINFTNQGKVISRAMSAQHLTRRKSKRTMQQSKSTILVNKSNLKKIKKLVPYK